MEKPSYYSVLSAKVRYDDRLRANEKLLYSEIVALSNKDGKCWASNSYFAKIYKVGNSTISTWINNLANNGYIVLTYVYKGNTKEIDKREIALTEVLTDANRGIHKKAIGIHKKIKGYSQNPKENITSINNKKEEKEINKEKVGIENEDYKKVINFYEDNITLITPTVAEDIENYLFIDKLQADLVIACMKEAVDRNKRNWKYIVSILNDCCNNKITTAKQFKIKQEEFRSNKNQNKKQDKTEEKIEYEEVHFESEEEYRKRLFKKQKG